MAEHVSQLRFKCMRNTQQTMPQHSSIFGKRGLYPTNCAMFRVVKRRQTSKRMYFLTCHGANPSKNTVYDTLRPHGRRIRLTGWYNKWRLYSAALSSCRHDIASTLMRGCLNFAGPLSNNNRIQLQYDEIFSRLQ